MKRRQLCPLPTGSTLRATFSVAHWTACWVALGMATATTLLPAPAAAETPPAAPRCRETPAPAAGQCSAAPSPPAGRSFPFAEEPADSIRLVLGGQRAVIDPETGELLEPRRATLDVSRRLFDRLRVPRRLEQRRLPNGAWVLGIEGRLLHPLFATVDGDGRPVPTHAWRRLDPHSPTPERDERKGDGETTGEGEDR